MEFHPAANIFPMITGDEYRALRDDIKANGLLEPIWTYDGKILDGRNRYAACLELKIEPTFREWKGEGSPTAFVVSMNLQRRHLTSSQRAIIALDVERMLAEEAKENQRKSTGRPTDKGFQIIENLIETEPIHAAKEAARMTGTNHQYVSDAKTIQEKSPELLEQVRSGEKTIPQAKREIVQMERKEAPALPSDKYRIIYADPPWKYGNSGTGIDNYGPAERHYPSMSIEELCNLPVKELTETDAVLFMWVTSPLLEECFDVIRAWGFKYKTSFVWDKVKHNFGHYNSVRHELLLICTRGSCTPDNLQLFDSVQEYERTEKHSEKPELFRTIIDTLYTKGRRIELFSRTEAEGWEVWGNEPNN